MLFALGGGKGSNAWEAMMRRRRLQRSIGMATDAATLSRAPLWSGRLVRWLTAIFISAIFAVATGTQNGRAENGERDTRRSVERVSFTDNEIADGFFKIAFGAELQFGARTERIRKFDEPVRAFVIADGAATRRSQIASVVADIHARVDHLDLAITDDPKAANLFIYLVPKRELGRTIRSLFGADKARAISRSLSPECLSGLAKDPRNRIQRAVVILPADTDPQVFLNCAYEEVLQALGPINDNLSIPWSMFNDDVRMGFFDVYDQYLLNILYDPRVQPGMTKDEVRNLLPEIMPTVRTWVDIAGCTARFLATAQTRNDPCGEGLPERGVKRAQQLTQPSTTPE